jgi:DNA topoisomerase-3
LHSERDGDGWKQTFRVGRIMCQKPITQEMAIDMVSKGKSELIKGFISKKGRPFDAFLLDQGLY